ncbi:GNAT family N-acetyltransferase [Cognatiyoonia sp. IB215182]|uniref:GNAT family N-acetyltransferase n=1 Tax=Cognatiyoonia sp. IB215182 TaxID=3097353 RepID=UPI002A12983D|nr:GNAT family N-acetyltransferase [Cognatiyoonia sp. IB215182]MDX8354633.1 GNAT family N-acetyltransferase [Cognatiyoonia sp. IB215182]
MELLLAADDDLAALAACEAPRLALRLPPNGLDAREVLEIVRASTARMFENGVRGTWMMTHDGEVVGLCGFKDVPSRDGTVEIGYGVAPDRRGRGLATAAIGALIGLTKAAGLRTMTAETDVANTPSERVLEKNGFTLTRQRKTVEGTFHDWTLSLRA